MTGNPALLLLNFIGKKMKQIIFAVLVMLGMSSQFALASEKQSRLYGGVGLVPLTNNHGMGITWQEAWFMSAPTTLSSGRSENNTGLSGNAFLGYKLSDRLSMELGYLGLGKGFTSATTGTVEGNLPTSDGTRGASVVVPFSVTQSKKVAAWHLSLIGEQPLSGSVSLLGRVGIMKSKTNWEQRITYNCNPTSCLPYQAVADTSKKTAPLFGVGLGLKVTDRARIRMEIKKSSALPSVAPEVGLVYHF